MNDSDFTLNGLEYKCRKMDAFEQFHIVRRMAPILKDLFPALAGMKTKLVPGVEQTEEQKFQAIAEFVSPIMMGLSQLTDDDSNRVLLSLLSCVEQRQGVAGWARVSNGKVLMFQNLELPELLQIAGKAFMFNLSGFFSALPKASPGGK